MKTKKHKKKILGELIKEKVKDSGLTVEEFAEAINSNRSTVYSKIFTCKDCDINTSTLILICKALKYNFFKELNINFEGIEETKNKSVFLIEMEDDEEFNKICNDKSIKIIYSQKLST